MKYLFLDIDGVLNHDDWYEKCYEKHIPFPNSSFDPDCVKRVNEILERTGAKLVISSSWRTAINLTKIFRNVGLPVEYDVTPSMTSFDCRGTEIQEYLDTHQPYDTYVILDDDNDMLDSQRKHFVRTRGGVEREGDDKLIEENGGTGLTDILKEKVIDILNEKGDE